MKEALDKKSEAIEQAPEGLSAPETAEAKRKVDGGGHRTPPEEVNKFDPRKIVGLFLAYWWLIVIFVLLGAGAGAAYCVLGTPKYRAACRYQVFVERTLTHGVETTLEQRTRGLDRQITILQSEVLQNRVKNKLAPEWENRIGDLDIQINVVKERHVPVLTIVADAIDEGYAEAFLREMISTYEEMRKLEEMEATERSLRSLRLEKNRLDNELGDGRERLNEFRQRHNLRITALRSRHEEERLENLVSRSNSLRMEAAMIATQLAALEDANTATINDVMALTLETHALTRSHSPSTAPAAVADDSDFSGDDSRGQRERSDALRLPTTILGSSQGARNWERYEERLARLEATYHDRLRLYRDDHPAMGALKQQMEQVRKEIEFESELARRRLRARYDALLIQQESLEAAVASWRNEYSGLSVVEDAEYRDIQGEVTRLNNLVTQLSNTIIDVASKSTEAIITQLIAEPRGRGQIWPKPLLVMGASTGGAAAIGIGLALAFFFLDTRFTDAVAIEHRLNLPFISGIPRWERVIKDLDPDVSIVMDKDHPNAVSESYRSLRVNLEKSMGEEKGYSLMLTSTDAGEGKSITTANLGIAFAWTGRRVLVLDADLRRPNLHNALGIKSNQTGFSQFLMGDVSDWRQLVQKTDFDNVDLLQAGKFVYEAPELCSPERLRTILREMGETYDLILLDTAPVGRIVDTAIMARACDGIVLVSLHGKTNVPGMRHSLKRLEGTNVLGFCLNAIDMPRGHGYYYGGYYNYRWQYGLYSYYYYYSTSLYGYDYGSGDYGYSGYGARHKQDEDEAEEAAGKAALDESRPADDKV